MPKYTVPFPNHNCIKKKDLAKVNKEIMKGKLRNFQKFVKNLDVKLPNSTLYTIDKVVRDRLREGRYGKDFSEYLNIESEEEHKLHYYHHEMLRLGQTSIQIPCIPHSQLLAEKLSKSPILPENRAKRGPSEYKSIRGPKAKKRARTVAKYGSVMNGRGTTKEDHKDWRMRKRATDRMKNKLIEEAKNEVRNQILQDMVKVSQWLRPSEPELENNEDENQSESQLEGDQIVKNSHGEENLDNPRIEFKNFKEF